MSQQKQYWDIFNQSIIQYHIQDHVRCKQNPFSEGSLERLFVFKKFGSLLPFSGILKTLSRDENISQMKRFL